MSEGSSDTDSAKGREGLANKRPKVEDEEESGDDVLTHDELRQVYESGSVGHDLDFFLDIMEVTKSTMETRLKELDALLGEKSWEKLNKACHTIKGSSAMLSLKAIKESSREAEAACKKAAESSSEEDSAIESLQVLRRELRRFLNTDYASFNPTQ